MTITDIDHDKKIHYEFGGPIGVLNMIIFFPILMWYLSFCVIHNNGHLSYMNELTMNSLYTSLLSFYNSIEFTWISFYAYGLFILFQFILAATMPGVIIKGLPVPSTGKKLDYLCNGIASFYMTLFVAFASHIGNSYGLPYTVSLTFIIKNYPSLLTASIIYGFSASILLYLSAFYFNITHRMSGNHIYDFFMGAPLHPRIGIVDLKMFLEIRIPWVFLFFLTLSATIDVLETKGYVSPNMIILLVAHFYYGNACMKGEECIPTTWDIFYEKLGFMLAFWNISGVPLTYCLCSVYLHSQLIKDVSLITPIAFHPVYVFCIFSALSIAYYIWDSSNSQYDFDLIL